MRRYLRDFVSILALYASAALSAQAQTPTFTLTSISPSSLNLVVDVGAGKAETTVTFTGSSFTNKMKVIFGEENTTSSGPILSSSVPQAAGTTKATAVFTLLNAAPPGTDSVNVSLEDDSVNPPRTSQAVSFQLGTSVCLEAIQSGGCQLRWEVDTTAVTGNGNQTNNSTTPNILVTLDYLFRPPKYTAQSAVAQAKANNPPGSPEQAQAMLLAKQQTHEAFGDRFSGHLVVQSGYTQVVAGSKAQPTTGTCANSSSTSCTIAAPQDAFVAQAVVRMGLTTGIDNEGTYGEFGLGAHGSVAYLIPKNQILQSGGLSYISLSAGNQDVVGSYEATGHFQLGQLNHDKTNSNGNEQNNSSLLFVEGGFQNNRGLQQLATTTPIDTRNRYVARFYLQPEIEGKKHTKVLVGMEYSGGLNGGPHVVQLFFGTNLNAAKLFGK